MFFLLPKSYYLKPTRNGFTLIELLVVISIISLLASIVMASLKEARSKARDIQRVIGMREFQKAVELYHAQNGKYPQGKDACSQPNLRRWLTCLQCAGSSFCHYDSTGMNSEIGTFLRQRPCDPLLPNNNTNGGCNYFDPVDYTNANQLGFFYKTNADRSEYKIGTSRVVENIDHVPQNMLDQKFIPGASQDKTISIYSSEKSRYWTRTCLSNAIAGEEDCDLCNSVTNIPCNDHP